MGNPSMVGRLRCRRSIDRWDGLRWPRAFLQRHNKHTPEQVRLSHLDLLSSRGSWLGRISWYVTVLRKG